MALTIWLASFVCYTFVVEDSIAEMVAIVKQDIKFFDDVPQDSGFTP